MCSVAHSCLQYRLAVPIADMAAPSRPDFAPPRELALLEPAMNLEPLFFGPPVPIETVAHAYFPPALHVQATLCHVHENYLKGVQIIAGLAPLI